MVSKVKLPQIVGIGEVVFDILPDSRKLGGAPADFLRYATKYGACGHLISAIGADDLGREVVSELKKFGINPVLAVTPYPTGRVLIFNNFGNYTAHILENAAWDYIPFTDAQEVVLSKADAVYFGTLALRKPYSRETILELIDSAPSSAYHFFDINLRQSYYDAPLIRTLLERADILKLNMDELKILKSLLKLTGDPDSVCLKLKEEYELKFLILTNGANSSHILGTNNLLTNMENSNLEQKFAFGAGNAFAGAFMSAILLGKEQQEAHQIANDAAIEVCRLKKENP